MLGGEAGVGQGFKYFMSGIELGRVNVAARGVGHRAGGAFEEAVKYAQERETFGKPIAQHQAIQLKLAQMATRAEAARLLDAPGGAEEGRAASGPTSRRAWRSYFATEAAQENALDACASTAATATRSSSSSSATTATRRCSSIGEGSNEIQQLIIARRLLEKAATA